MLPWRNLRCSIHFLYFLNVVCDILQLYIFLEEMANEDNVKSLRKDNNELKKQLQELTKDFEKLKSKMAEQRRNQASPVTQPNEQDMQFLSDQYDDLLKSRTSLEEEVDKLSRKLDLLAKDITESIKPSMTFSVIAISTT